MLHRISSVVLFACLIAGGASAANDAFVGEWKLNPAKSRLVDVMKVRSAGGNKYIFDLGAGPETIAVDGTDQPGFGGTMLSVTPEGADSWKVVRKKGGRMLLMASWTLSKGGKTLRDAFTAIGSDGSRSTTNFVYQRKAGTSGFAGTWESRNNATMNFAFLLKVEPYQGNGLSIIDSTDGLTMNVKFDGKDYPSGGANAPKGFTASARRADQHTIEVTGKVNGKARLTQLMSLSSDLKTLTVTQRIGRREPNILVLERG
ncbi:MAG TPA: hypothetical protein VGF62_03110 [Rhizomicrobium sp.]